MPGELAEKSRKPLFINDLQVFFQLAQGLLNSMRLLNKRQPSIHPSTTGVTPCP